MLKPGIIILVFLALGFSNGLAQGTVEHKYSVALRTYTPIYLTGSNKYYNDDWILTENSNYKRAYFKYAFGFDFTYFLSDNVSLNFWNGLSRRTLHEESYSESYNLFGQLMTNSASFDYAQNSYNASIGLKFSESVKKFRVNMGIEISYLHTGKGKQVNSSCFMEYENVNLPDSIHSITATSISDGNSWGLGLSLGMEYRLTPRISLGVNVHEFLYYSLFNHSTISQWSAYSRNTGAPTIDQEGTNESKDNFRQLAFSSLLPSLDIRYYFK
ncbi:MAG: hypothetical protein ACKO68_04115 [Bacteroidota bacterium]